MAAFTVTFTTDNAAFNGPDGFRVETARILRQVAWAILVGKVAGTVYDVNGNRIGHYAQGTEA